MSSMNIFEQYWKPVFAGFVILIIVGGGAVMLSNQSKSKEKKIQEDYYSIEKKLIDLKAKANPLDPKAELPDFSGVKKDFEQFIASHTGSIAAQMAALHLSQLFIDENKTQEALDLLKKVQTKDKGLVNTLVQQQMAQLMAGQGQCAEAVSTWQQIIDRKEAQFLQNELKLQQAICYVQMKEVAKAEEILKSLSAQTNQSDFGASAATKEAEKYLRLLQFKKATGG